MTDTIDTSTEATVARVEQLRRCGCKACMDNADLLDALAKERDAAKNQLTVLGGALAWHKGRRADAERERDEARRMLKRYGVHSPRCAKNRWPKAGETFAECDCGYDRAREAGR